MSTLSQRIKHRRDTSANWLLKNPILAPGELGIEIDASSLRGKYGDGVSTWSVLPYTELGQRPDFEAIAFDQAAAVVVEKAQLAWNEDEQTLDLGKGGGVSLQLGQEQMSLCRNATNAVIPNGTALMFAGTLGNSGKLLVAPMIANGSVPGYVFFGIASAAIQPGADGFVTTFGKVRGVNLTAFAEGDILWCNPSVPGGLTKTEPQAPNLKLPVAAVISNKTNGIMMVRADTGRRLADLHDVEANGNKQDGDVLSWDASEGRWAPSSPAANVSLGQLSDVNTTAKQDQSVLYYSQAESKWKGDDVNTIVTITDGGNF